jgi:hypothetical protein
VQGLILDGVKQGKIDTNFKIKFGNEVRDFKKYILLNIFIVYSQNGACPTPFMDTMKELMPEYFDFSAGAYAIPAY